MVLPLMLLLFIPIFLACTIFIPGHARKSWQTTRFYSPGIFIKTAGATSGVV